MKIVTNDNWKIGDKVVRGRDWDWSDQDRDSVYGIIHENHDLKWWLIVKWVDKEGNLKSQYGYRVGYEGKYDLYFYEGDENEQFKFML